MAQLKDSIITGDLRVTGTIYGLLHGGGSSAALTTTANAIAYFSDTAGTFASKPSGNGALYATSTNGALTFGTLPIAQGGTGATSATNARTNLGLGTLATKSSIADHSYTYPTGATSRTADVALNTTTVNSITAVGTLPELTITSTACDDITAWSAGTMFSAAVNNEVLTFTAGTAPNLSYTARSVGSASGWSAGTLPTKGADTTVATSVKTQPTFTVTTATGNLAHTIS